jgi:Uma2 family endonuclease
MIAAVSQDLVRRHRITVEEYYRMAEVGLLAPDARVELIEGEIIDMAPQGITHASLIMRLDAILHLAAADHFIVSTQLPLRLDQYSEPEPDFTLLKWRKDTYATARPTPADTLLAIEVSQSSLRYDRRRKLPLYARHGIAEVWIIDVTKPLLYSFDSPIADQSGARAEYRRQSSTPQPGVMTLKALPNLAVDLTGLFEDL